MKASIIILQPPSLKQHVDSGILMSQFSTGRVYSRGIAITTPYVRPYAKKFYFK